jgi:hypothetical protein
MKKRFVPVVARALTLVALVAMNTALPAEGFDECYSCLEISGQPPLCFPGAQSGHAYCEVHDDHCDQALPCIS